MAHKGLGQLLTEYEVAGTADYYALPPGKQSMFVSRLYSELEEHAKEGIESLKSGRGLKLHFVVKELPDEGFSNLPSDAFFRKTCFYANQTLVTFPFRDSEKSSQTVIRRGHSATVKRNKEIVSFGKYRAQRGGEVQEIGKNHHLYRAEFDTFLHLLCTAHPFLDSGYLTIVPSYQPEAKRFDIRTKARLGLHSANFRREDLRRQFEEEGYKDLVMGSGIAPYLYLPYFSDLNAEEVLKVRREEWYLYNDFQRKLADLLGGLPEQDTESKLFDLLKEIDRGVIHLVERAKEIQKSERKRDVISLIGFVSIGLCMLLSPASAAAVAALLGTGSFSAFRYIEARRETDPQKARLKEDEFYLMWRLLKPEENRI
ncbi:MAG TPA: hypothetical protein VF789_25300 [Thermoanaerobaculia bacterium]